MNIRDTLTTHQIGRAEVVLRPPSFSWIGLILNLQRLFQYRDLVYTLSVHRVKVRYKQTILGTAWAILQPLAIMLVFTLVFSIIARIPTDGAPYPVFAYAALLPWTFFSTAVSSSATGLVGHAQLITKVYFPREILPLTYVIAAGFDFLVASIVLAGLLIYYGISITIQALYIVPISAILIVLTTAISLLLSAIHIRFRDVGVALPFLLQFLMYATPVIYPLNAVPRSLLPLYSLNPMVGIIEGFRRALVYGAVPDFELLAISSGTSMFLLLFAYLYFKRVEATMADII